MKEITIFRVRKAPFDLRSQKGAYFIFEAALKVAIKHKCNIYDNDKNCVWQYKAMKKRRITI